MGTELQADSNIRIAVVVIIAVDLIVVAVSFAEGLVLAVGPFGQNLARYPISA